MEIGIILSSGIWIALWVFILGTFVLKITQIVKIKVKEHRERNYKNLSLAGIKDLDKKILLLLQPQDLLNMKRLNNYFNKLCDDKFIETYLKTQYPNDPHILKKKLEEICYYIGELKKYDWEYTGGDYTEILYLLKEYPNNCNYLKNQYACEHGIKEYLDKYLNDENFDLAFLFYCKKKLRLHLMEKYHNHITDNEDISMLISHFIRKDDAKSLECILYKFPKEYSKEYLNDKIDLAIEYRSFESFEFLYSYISKLHPNINERIQEMLELCIDFKNYEVFSYLLDIVQKQKGNINIDLTELLVMACSCLNLEMVEDLVYIGADVNAQDMLYHTIRSKNYDGNNLIEVILYLLSQGAIPRCNNFAALRLAMDRYGPHISKIFLDYI